MGSYGEYTKDNSPPENTLFMRVWGVVVSMGGNFCKSFVRVNTVPYSIRDITHNKNNYTKQPPTTPQLTTLILSQFHILLYTFQIIDREDNTWNKALINH